MIVDLITRHKKLIIAFLLFAVVFGVYLYTAPRYQTGYGDSEEVMTAAYVLGIPHAPGYPLYMILAHAFRYLPFGSAAFRFSVFSSLLGSLTVVLIYLSLVKVFRMMTRAGQGLFPWLIPQVSALAASLSLAFSYAYWLYSIIPEVYCVSRFFVSLLLFVSVSWYEDRNKDKARFYPALVVFVFTLGFIGHQTTILLVPPLLYLVWALDKEIFVPSKRWFLIAGALVLGALPLLYLPLAAMREPALDYGNPVTPRLFWNHITRAIYRKGDTALSAYGFGQDRDLGAMLGGIPVYFSFLIREFTIPILVLGFLGCLFFLKGRARLGVFLLLCFVFTGPAFAFRSQWKAHLNNFNNEGARERAVLSSYVCFTPLVGAGIFFYLNLLKSLKFSKVFMLFFCTLSLVFPLHPLRDNFNVVNKRDFVLGRDYARNLFLNIEENGILFLKGDRPTFTAFYYTVVEGQRQDVTILPFSFEKWNIERLAEREPDLFDTENKALLAVYRDVIHENMGKRPIYTTGLPKSTLTQLGVAGNPYVVSPRGLIGEITEEFDSGKEYWDRLIWNSPKNIDAYYDWYAKELIEQYVIGRSNSYYHHRLRNHYPEARDDYLKMKAIAPYHDLTLNVEGDFKRFDKNSQPIKFSLGKAEDHFQIARRYLSEGKIAEAMSEYWLAIHLEPDNNLYRLQLGGAYESLGWTREAYEQYKRIVETETENELVLKKARERLEVTRYKLEDL